MLLADTVTQLLAEASHRSAQSKQHSLTASLSEILVHLYRACRPRDRSSSLSEHVTWISPERSLDQDLLKTLSGAECGLCSEVTCVYASISANNAPACK